MSTAVRQAMIDAGVIRPATAAELRSIDSMIYPQKGTGVRLDEIGRAAARRHNLAWISSGRREREFLTDVEREERRTAKGKYHV